MVKKPGGKVSAEVAALLPDLGRNKKFLKRQEFKKKQRKLVKERELPPAARARVAAKALKKTKAGAKKVTATKKGARPTTAVRGVKTGKETLRKKKARELVQRNKEAAEGTLRKKKNAVAAGRQQRKARTSEEEAPRSLGDTDNAQTPAMRGEEHEKALIARAIRGEAYDAAAPSLALRQDPTLYPDLAFFEEYAHKKTAEAVSEDQLLMNAHQYFKVLGKRERVMHRAAVRHLKQLKTINRRGGDKDGFRYVVPKDTRQVVRQIMAAKGAEGADIDPDTLVSTFGGDGIHETEEKPIRRHRKRRSTFSDFYQFQVSKRWTRNAENFLKRGRADKSLFEAKKHQRSIKKL